MNYLETLLSVSSLIVQVALCVIVFTRKTHKVMPLFAIFVYTVSLTTFFLILSSIYFGFKSPAYFYGFWASVFLFVTTRSLAIAELCRYGLRNYRGIWALLWRVLTVISIYLVAHALIDAWGQPNGIAIYWATFARDFAFASTVVLAVLFLFRSYYGLAPDARVRLIAGGLCLTCAVDIIVYTLLLSLFKGYLFPWFLESQRALWPVMEPVVRRMEDIFSAVHLVCFMIAAGIWCYVFREPLPQEAEAPRLLPAEVYRELSPAINVRLATFNQRLLELLKP